MIILKALAIDVFAGSKLAVSFSYSYFEIAPVEYSF